MDEIDGADARADQDQHTSISDNSDDDGTYYFESDHLALKENKDYRKLLKTLVTLEAQRQQAISDLDTLLDRQNEALKDPIDFVKKLQGGVNMNFPKPMKIAPLPDIDWDAYVSGSEQFNLQFSRHMTRAKRGCFDTSSVVSDADSFSVRSSSPLDYDNNAVIRGRVKDETKSDSFNKLWTAEEQKRLEDLLMKHPPEPVEAKRWQKIASALGNRTTVQVASRVQKYFIKLAKAGLPIPGRLPNVAALNKKGANHKHHRHNRFYYQPSTFMQAYEPPVYMSDDDDDRSSKTNEFGFTSDDESIPATMRNSNEYQELMKLKQIRKERLQESSTDGTIIQHLGYKCDKCQCEPILGVKWHCLDCPSEASIDLCHECIDSPFETATHNSSHRMNPVHFPQTQAVVDKDYTKLASDGLNYLDPNFMPIT